MEKTQITIELFNQCKGTCTGCLLTLDERKSITPLMSSKVFDRVIGELATYGQKIRRKYRPIMAFGDFPAMDPDEQEVFFDILQKHSMDFGFTLTLVDEQKRKQYFDTIERALNISPRTLFDLTVDPFRLKNNSAYREMMRSSVDKMNHFHMAVLLSEAVITKMSPEELSSLMRDVFGESLQVNLAFTPSLSNIEKKNYGYQVNSAADFYNRFLDTSPALQSHREREIERYYDANKSNSDYQGYLGHSFHIKHDTSVYPVVHTIFGDIILDNRNGHNNSLGRVINQDLGLILNSNSKYLGYLNTHNNIFMNKGDFNCKACDYFNSCKFHGVGLMRKIYKEYENRTGSCYGPVDFAQ